MLNCSAQLNAFDDVDYNAFDVDNYSTFDGDDDNVLYAALL